MKQYWSDAFPFLPSYQRFIEWIPSTLIPLCVYLKHCFGKCTGIGFIDKGELESLPQSSNFTPEGVFKGLADRGKTSVDWFFGFKLHLVVNEFGQLLNVTITPGNVDDRQPVRDLRAWSVW